MKNQTLDNYKILYLFIFFYYFRCLFVFLYLKHDVGNDSTISEWIINYSGGFTKRGLIGQIVVYFSRFFDSELREIILYFQILIIGTYFILIFIFLKNIFFERIYLLCILKYFFIFTQFMRLKYFRKEVFIYILFIIHLFVLINKFKYANISN